MRLLRQPWLAPRRDEPVGGLQVDRQLQRCAEKAQQADFRITHPDLHVHRR